MDSINFETHPDQYKHWRLEIDGEVARLWMNVNDEHPLREGYELKLNSYDLSVDIELADVVQRVRFEHPQVKCLVISAELDRVFCSGANIYMLGASTHSFKVNFCKYTNETRIYLEDASQNSGITSFAACKGTTAGGGYELALACDEIALVDDGNSAVSFPETPLLAVLPGTGGLTRLVDKRKVRRDRADVFCTLAEGIKGKRAVEWDLVDHLFSRSKFEEGVNERVQTIVQEKAEIPRGPAVQLTSVAPNIDGDTFNYEYVTLDLDRENRTGTLTVHSPKEAPPQTVDEMTAQGDQLWALKAFRELDHALIHLRFNEPLIGLVLVKTAGNPEFVLAADQAVAQHKGSNGFIREVSLLQSRVLRRLDNTARSFFAVIDDTSNCFAGSLLELALSVDRVYMLEDEDEKVGVWISEANAHMHPTANGLSRLKVRFLSNPGQVDEILGQKGQFIDTLSAEKLGIATIALDDIDFEDELRIAVEERASLSPDALTGMEASLRFAGPETMETKIFGRLSAWQNWIFTRPNATGKDGALTLYGRPERPSFNWNRT